MREPRTPLGLVRFKARAADLQAAYAERRAQWLRDHPKAKVADVVTNLSVEDLRK